MSHKAQLEITPARLEITQQTQQEPEHNSAFFQAIGILLGEVSFESDKLAKVTVKGKQYPLLYKPRLKKAMAALKREIEKSGITTQRLVVYPKVMHFPKPDQPYQIAFQLLGFQKNSAFSSIFMDLKDFEFKLAGLWQFIPVCPVPVISVFRNFDETILENLKKLKPRNAAQKKVKFMKPVHVPVNWQDSPIQPFRFNPAIDKQEQGRPLFVQIKAKFVPAKNGFEFVVLLAPPLEEAPKCFKASNEDKATVQKQKRQKATTSLPEEN